MFGIGKLRLPYFYFGAVFKANIIYTMAQLRNKRIFNNGLSLQRFFACAS